jgi:hypothetical protein
MDYRVKIGPKDKMILKINFNERAMIKKTIDTIKILSS